MKYQHPSIVINQPAPGHYVITGHQPRSVFVEGEGHLVPSSECYISPEVPSDALIAILEDRGVFPPLFSFDSETGKVSLVGNSLDVIIAAIPEAPDTATAEEIAKAVKQMIDSIEELEEENTEFTKEGKKQATEIDRLTKALTAEKESGKKLATENAKLREAAEKDAAAIKQAEQAKGGDK